MKAKKIVKKIVPTSLYMAVLESDPFKEYETVSQETDNIAQLHPRYNTVNQSASQVSLSLPRTQEQRVLIISNTGGGAHESLARNLVQQLESSSPAERVTYQKKDFLSRDLNYPFIKRIADRYYNKASVNGEGRLQSYLMSTRGLSELIFIPVVFEKMLQLLLEMKPTRVVCTEPIGLIPMVRALRVYNAIVRRSNQKRRKQAEIPGTRPKEVPEFELWMTDMPTVYAQHTFQFLRFMPKSEKRMLKLYTPPPLLWRTRATNEEEFWWQQCRFRPYEDNVRYLAFTHRDVANGMPLSVSPRFIEHEPTVGKSVRIPIQLSTCDERRILWQLCHNLLSREQEENAATEAHIRLQNDDIVVSCMLSSRPNTRAMLGYLSMMVSQIEQLNRNHQETGYLSRQAELEKRRMVFFMFCGRHTLGQRDSTFARVSNRMRFITRRMNMAYLDNAVRKWTLNIVPLGFQNPNSVAAITARSDVHIRQSGGLSCMEIIAMDKVAKSHKVQKKWLVHVELQPEWEGNRPDMLRARAIDKFIIQHHHPMKEITDDVWEMEEEAIFQWLVAHSCRSWEAGNAQYLRESVGAIAVSPWISPSRILIP